MPSFTHRGITWETALALLEQAQAEEAATAPAPSKPTDSSRPFRRASSSLTGFYMTRNAFQGRHFVALALEKGSMSGRTSSVIFVRPYTGRHEIQKLVRFYS